MKYLVPVFLLATGAPPALAMDLQPFHTPSGNIHCLFITDGGQSSVECDLRSRTSTRAVLPQPADCDLEWGDRFALGAKGKPGLVCHGDTLFTPDSPVLAYGKTMTWKSGIACTAAKSGITCKNRQGHGFSLSRSKQRLF